MKKILTLALLFCFVIAEDEFFEPGISLGGYGEMHYNNWVDPDDSDAEPETKLDFHRWILFVNYNFTPEWSLKSEVELEHNMVGGSYGGYMELEQAYINYHNADGNWGWGAGTMLISAGIINETHEPPTFLSVERPAYNSKIIPTTWFGNGFMAYKSFGDVHAKFVLHEDMNGLGMVNDDVDGFAGLRGGRAKGYKSTAYHWTKNMSVHYTGMEGVNLGGSYTFGGAPTGLGDVHEDYVDWNLFEVHAQYDANNIVGAFEYGTVNFAHETDGSYDGLPDQVASGYYFHVGYNVADMMGWEDCKLVPWFGMNNYDLNDLDDDGGAEDTVSSTLLGLTWWPTDKVSFKVDYDMQVTSGDGTEADPDSKKNTLSIGVGYMF